MESINIPDSLPEIRYIDISDEDYQKIMSLFHFQPERSKREDPVLLMAKLTGEVMRSWEDNIINEMGCGALNSMET